MPCQKRTLDEPEVVAVLTGVKRGSNRYYKKDPLTGITYEFHARKKLMELSMSEATASRLLRQSLKSGLIVEEDVDLAQESHQRAVVNAKQGVAAVAASDEDEDEDGEGNESGNRATSKLPLGFGDVPQGNLYRFDLIKQNEWWGIIDNLYEHIDIISRDRNETLEELYSRRRGQRDGDCFRWSDILQKTV